MSQHQTGNCYKTPTASRDILPSATQQTCIERTLQNPDFSHEYKRCRNLTHFSHARTSWFQFISLLKTQPLEFVIFSPNKRLCILGWREKGDPTHPQLLQNWPAQKSALMFSSKQGTSAEKQGLRLLSSHCTTSFPGWGVHHRLPLQIFLHSSFSYLWVQHYPASDEVLYKLSYLDNLSL